MVTLGATRASAKCRHTIMSEQLAMDRTDYHGDEKYGSLETMEQRRFDLIKLELSTLALKIDMSVKNFWTIRSFATTIWSGLIAIGIGQFANGVVSPSLLIISLFMPAIFFFIDAEYQRGYRRVMLREREISRFLNAPPCAVVNEEQNTRLDSHGEPTSYQFPVYDVEAAYKRAEDRDYAWETSLSRQFL